MTRKISQGTVQTFQIPRTEKPQIDASKWLTNKLNQTLFTRKNAQSERWYALNDREQDSSTERCSTLPGLEFQDIATYEQNGLNKSTEYKLKQWNKWNTVTRNPTKKQ